MLALGAACAACAARSAPSTTDSLEGRASPAGTTDALVVPDAPPQLASVSPLTIALGRGESPTLTLTGSGFVAGARGTFSTGGNTIRVGPATFDAVAADSAGTVIRFVLPLTYTDTTAKGRPQSFTPGDYPISVVTPKGTSNALTLTMIL
jgi:hypothetical protein